MLLQNELQDIIGNNQYSDQQDLMSENNYSSDLEIGRQDTPEAENDLKSHIDWQESIPVNKNSENSVKEIVAERPEAVKGTPKNTTEQNKDSFADEVDELFLTIQKAHKMRCKPIVP